MHCADAPGGHERLANHGGAACDSLVAVASVSALPALSSSSAFGLPAAFSLPRASSSRGESGWSWPVQMARGHVYEVSMDLLRTDGRPGTAAITVHAPGVTRHLVGNGAGATRVAFRFEAPSTGESEVRVLPEGEPVTVEQLRVQRVAEPGSIPLLAFGLACIGLLLNRRRPSPLIPQVARS
jgi:hypothetical protein